MRQLILVVFLFTIVWARPTSTQNVLAGVIAKGLVVDAQYMTDDDPHTFATVSANGWFNCTLPYPLYIKRMVVTFVTGNMPEKVSVERLLTAQEQLPLYIGQPNSATLTIDVQSLAVKKLIFKLQAKHPVRIADIKVYPDMDQWPEVTSQNILLAGDTDVLLRFVSNLELSGIVSLENPAQGVLKKAAPFYTQQQDILIHGLLPQTNYALSYDYEDLHGNKDQSSPLTIQTKSLSLAWHKPVSGTFTEEQPGDAYVIPTKDPLARAVDGDDSYFSSMITSGDTDRAEQNLTIDLQAEQSIKEIAIYWRALAYSQAYDIYLSQDAVVWKKIITQADAKQGIKAFSRTGDPLLLVVHDIPAVTGRYIKLVVPQGSAYYRADQRWKFVQIMEIKVF